ncbi:DsbA family protein [Luedemannella helvata]|uniref:DsbA family protein n=1 Tax=Luedemannella helvata TaxID=349315 RepID=A0ABP4WN86_9ACTN
MEIEIYSDVICPWCYIGTRRLTEALRSYDGEVTLRWRAYQLDPSAPADGQPLLPWLGARYGGEARARQMFGSAAAAGASAGITMNFESALVANTFDAHRLIWFAGSPQAVPFGADADTQQHVVEALHAAHFTHGQDIAATDTLVQAAVSVGLDQARVEKLLASDEGVAEVRAELAEGRELGITSVPTFIFAGKYAVTGAQDAATLSSVLDEVARREGIRPVLRTLVGSHATHDNRHPHPATAGDTADPATPRIPRPRTPDLDACTDDTCH